MLALRLLLLTATLSICNMALSNAITSDTDDSTVVLQTHKHRHILRPQLYRYPKISPMLTSSEKKRLYKIGLEYRLVDRVDLKTLPSILRNDIHSDSFTVFQKGDQIPVSQNISSSSPHQQFEILRAANVNDWPTKWTVMQVVGLATLQVVNNGITTMIITEAKQELRPGYFVRELGLAKPFSINTVEHSVMGKIVLDTGQASVMSAGKIVRLQFDNVHALADVKGGLLGIYKNIREAQNQRHSVGKLILLTDVDNRGYSLAAVLNLKPSFTQQYMVSSVPSHE